MNDGLQVLAVPALMLLLHFKGRHLEIRATLFAI